MVFRVLGVAGAVIALYLIVTGVEDFLESMNSASMDMPTGSMARFAGGGFLMVASFVLNLGFDSMGARYLAGEHSPVIKDTVTYLTDGKGILGVGATAPNAAGTSPAGGTASGRYCRTCGASNDADASSATPAAPRWRELESIAAH